MHAQRDLAVLLLPDNGAYVRGPIDTTVEPDEAIEGWDCYNQLLDGPMPIASVRASYYARDNGNNDYDIMVYQYRNVDDARLTIDDDMLLVERCNGSVLPNGRVVELHMTPTSTLEAPNADVSLRIDTTVYARETVIAYVETNVLRKDDVIVLLRKNANTGRNPWTYRQYLDQLVRELDARLAE